MAPPSGHSYSLGTGSTDPITPRRPSLLVIGSIVGLVSPVVISILDFLYRLVGGYSSNLALVTGYSGIGTSLWYGDQLWYTDEAQVSLVAVVSLVAYGGVLAASFTRRRPAKVLALTVAPILLVFFLADMVGLITGSYYDGWSGWFVVAVVLALEFAPPVLLLIGAVRSPSRMDPWPQWMEQPADQRRGAAGSSRHDGRQTGPTDGLAIAALVLSILGLVLCLVGSIVGLVLGYVSRGQIRDSGGAKGGAGLATASIVIGWVGLGLAGVVAVAYVVLASSA